MAQEDPWAGFDASSGEKHTPAPAKASDPWSGFDAGTAVAEEAPPAGDTSSFFKSQGPVSPGTEGTSKAQPESKHGALNAMAHTAYKGLLGLGEVGTRAIGKLLPEDIRDNPSMWPQPGDPEKFAQQHFPINPGEESSFAGVAGSVGGGLLETAAMGPGGNVTAPLAFGGQSFVETFDAAKAAGKTDEEATQAAIPQGLLTAAANHYLPKLVGKINVGSGGALMQAVKKVAAGGAVFTTVGMADQTISNLIHKYTDEPDREILTGLKGRAATDAATGILLSVLFPGHPMADHTKAAMEAARPPAPEERMPLARPEPEPVQKGEAAPPETRQADVSLEQPATKPLAGTEQQKAPEAPTEEPHPAQAHIDELKDIGQKRDALEKRAKWLRQRGRQEEAAAADRERMGLNMRQADVAREMAAKVAESQAAQPVERRLDREQRERVAAMTPEGQRQALYTSEKTGLPNERAYKEAPKSDAVHTYFDLDNFSWFNDTLGHDIGDEAIKKVGEAVKAEAPDTAFHLHGDEFLLLHNDKASADATMQRIRERLANETIEGTDKNGNRVVKKGIGVTYGHGETLAESDAQMLKSKGERTAEGLRAKKGEEPGGITRTPAEGAKPSEPLTQLASPVGEEKRKPAFSQKMFRGEGASPEDIYGPENVAAGRGHPLLGPGKYFSFDEAGAKHYGDVSEHHVELEKPLVLDSDSQWRDLLQKADAMQLSSVDSKMGSTKEASERLQSYLKKQGYDGVIVHAPWESDVNARGEKLKRLRESFGQSQVVVFQKPEMTPGEPLTQLASPAGEEKKKPWEMNLEQIRTAETEAKGGDKALVIRLFGEEGAKKYERLYRAENSMDRATADRASSERQAMEDKLSQADQDKLFGRGETGPTHEDLAEYRKKLEDVDTESPEAMGRSLRWAVSELGGAESTDPAKMTEKQRVRYAQTRHALSIAKENGWSPESVLKPAIKAAAERFSDPQDALFMLRRFLPGMQENAAGFMVPREMTPKEAIHSSMQEEIARAPAASPEDSKLAVEHTNEIVKQVNDAGEPPGPPKPPMPIDEIPEPSNPKSRQALEDWLGNLWGTRAWANIEAAKKMDALGRVTPRGKLEVFKKRSEHEVVQADKALSTHMDTMGKLDSEYRKYGESLSAEKKDRLERAANLNPEQRAIAERMLTENQETSVLGQDAGLWQNFNELFTKRLWKNFNPDEMPRQARGKFATFTTGQLRRTLSSQLEGWAAGKELAIEGAIGQQLWNRITVEDVIHNKNLIETGKKFGLMGGTKQEGWKLIEHPGFKDWRVVASIKMPGTMEEMRDALAKATGETVPDTEAVKVYGWSKEGRDSAVVGRDLLISPKGDTITILHKDPLYAEPELADGINRALEKSQLRDRKYVTPFGKNIVTQNGIDAVNTRIRSAIMFTSLFHHISETANYMLGTPFQHVQDLSPRFAYKQGYGAIENWTPDIELGVKNSLNLSVAPEMNEVMMRERGRIGKAIEKLPVLGGAQEFFSNMLDQQMHFLFNRYIPGLKAHFYQLELNRLREVNKAALENGTRTQADLAKAAANLSNNMFGNLNLQALGRDPTVQHVLRTFAFAPDWEEAALRRGYEAFKIGATGEAHRMMWARTIGRLAVAHAAFNFASALMENKDHPVDQWLTNMERAYGKGLKQLFGWDITPILAKFGRKNPGRVYLGITGSMADPANLAADPFGYLKDRLAVVPKMALEAADGMDAVGRKFTTYHELTKVDDKGTYETTEYGKHVVGQPKGGKMGGEFSDYRSDAAPGHLRLQQVPSFIGSQAEHSIPIGAKALVDYLGGQMDGWEATLRAIGARVTTAKEQKPPEMKKLGL